MYVKVFLWTWITSAKKEEKKKKIKDDNNLADVDMYVVRFRASQVWREMDVLPTHIAISQIDANFRVTRWVDEKVAHNVHSPTQFFVKTDT
jgi:hypothetical protein